MDEAIRKARVLIEALSWIQRFRGRYVVIKLGGSTLDDAAAVDSLLVDVVFMAAVGMRPVIVHGGGKAISAGMAQAGIQQHAETLFMLKAHFSDATHDAVIQCCIA